MADLRDELADIINLFAPGDGPHESLLPAVRWMKVSQPTNSAKQCWHPSMSIIAQGCKEITLGCETYRYGETNYIATPVDLPITSRICSATPEKPFLGFQILLDPLTLSEVAAQIEKSSPAERDNPVRAVFIGKASDPMLDAAVRLGKLCRTPEDAPVLGPLVIKELVYHLLKGADGQAIRQFVRAGSNMHNISQAIYSLRSQLDAAIDVAALAKAANMSRSAFFQHFKEVTAMSPIQYQKRLRLLEARRLMTEEDETAEGSAFKVGYNSASQFSREYSRMFGNSPLRHTMKCRSASRDSEHSILMS